MSLVRDLAPVTPTDIGPCKVCGGRAPLHVVVDFNKNCEELHGYFLPLSGVPVYYGRCETCGFLFTRFCDGWTDEDFGRHIYNDDYIKVDPEHTEARPARVAPVVPRWFFRDLSRLSILDWGGGSGAMKRELERFGAKRVEAYDPFVPAYAKKPEGKFQLVTCFEVIEHMADPLAAVMEMASFLDPEEGGILHSTAPIPEDHIVKHNMWTYLAPRNGHISLFSYEALERLWRRAGLHFCRISLDIHIAFVKPPAYAGHMISAVAEAVEKGLAAPGAGVGAPTKA